MENKYIIIGTLVVGFSLSGLQAQMVQSEELEVFKRESEKIRSAISKQREENAKVKSEIDELDLEIESTREDIDGAGEDEEAFVSAHAKYLDLERRKYTRLHQQASAGLETYSSGIQAIDTLLETFGDRKAEDSLDEKTLQPFREVLSDHYDSNDNLLELLEGSDVRSDLAQRLDSSSRILKQMIEQHRSNYSNNAYNSLGEELKKMRGIFESQRARYALMRGLFVQDLEALRGGALFAQIMSVERRMNKELHSLMSYEDPLGFEELDREKTYRYALEAPMKRQTGYDTGEQGSPRSSSTKGLGSLSIRPDGL